MLKSGAERTRAWCERKCTSEVTVQNVKKNGVNNKDNEPATSISAQPPPLASISDNLQYSDFPVIQKFHFYRASLRHNLFFFQFFDTLLTGREIFYIFDNLTKF
jgi:hypothetical protein